MDETSAIKSSPGTFRFSGELFCSFFRLGLTAFGGPAMVAYIRQLAIEKNQWLDEATFRQGVAICQVIPGATAMQVAAYVGLRSGGPLGAIMAYLGFGLPAFLLMVILAALYQSTHDQAAIVAVFRGLQLVVIAIVAGAAVSFGRSTVKTWQDIVLGLGVAAFLVAGGSVVPAIAAAAIIGLFLYKQKHVATDNSLPPVAFTLSHLRTPLLLITVLLAGMALLYFGNRRLFHLSLVMVKVDFFAFGGGYGSLPLMFHEVVDVRHWLDGKTFLDGIALGQITPGPIVITATFVGYLVALLPGALVGTIGIFAPSLILLTAAVPYFDRIRHNAHFQRAMHGTLVSFVGLLLSVTVRFALAVEWGVLQGVLVALAFLALYRKVDMLWVVLGGAVFSFLLL
ncbi:MAG TPA: hypothetical protein DDY32_03020 [Desulfobulbaceae bacterium]|nr:hypothetical protein [Desulfobulbaceae bacterium]